MIDHINPAAIRELVDDDAAGRSADHQSMALAAAGLGSWDYDLTTAEVYCSTHCKEILGLPPQGAATPEGLLEAVTPADFPKVQRAYAAATSPDNAGDILTDLRINGVQDGRERWVRVKGRTLFDKGVPVRMVGTLEDITAIKRVEADRNRDVLFSQALARNIGDGVYTLDKAGHVTFLNSVGEKLLGWSADELHGRDIHETIHFQHADGSPYPRENCPLMAVLDSGETVRDEDDVFTTKTGTFLPVSYCSSPIIEAGEILGAVVAFRDISARKAADREQQILLSSERAARSRAEHALHDHEEKLTAGIHHLRSPLNGILGWAQLLLEGDSSSAELTEGLQAISRGVTAQNEILASLSAAKTVKATIDDAFTADGRSIADHIAKLTVLVVDDEDDARNLVKKILENCEVLVLTAKSAEEALKIVEQARPDVLVSDIGMPVTDGYTLLRQIRALGNDRGGNIPAIAVTAFARAEDRTRALLAGYRVHIPKPLDAVELITTIASLAGKL